MLRALDPLTAQGVRCGVLCNPFTQALWLQVSAKLTFRESRTAMLATIHQALRRCPGPGDGSKMHATCSQKTKANSYDFVYGSSSSEIACHPVAKVDLDPASGGGRFGSGSSSIKTSPGVPRPFGRFCVFLYCLRRPYLGTSFSQGMGRPRFGRNRESRTRRARPPALALL